ncbi:hypothetical protein [Haloferula sp. BvORR071]|uniref:hypothetical protein n=1 Tax=Haloferula sp. BvORR071 TaxID=1396141 RepID=UPI000550916C|nr:hypothetical protein [Haloferula sp. BvORR071]
MVPALHAGEMRIWTSRKGGTLEAELLRADDTNATLLTKERKETLVPLADLSIADRQFMVENTGADLKILALGEVGKPELQVKFDSSSFKKLKTSNLTFSDESESDFELMETEHFLVATAGGVRPQGIAETAERMWHGMAFQHMNFRQDWGDKRMLIMIVEKDEVYKKLGAWYKTSLKERGKDEEASKVAATWDKASGHGLAMPDKMTEKHNIFPEAFLLHVTPESSHLYKKPMGPFLVNVFASLLLDRQMGNVSSFGGEGLFAVQSGHSFYKEIWLTGESETNFLAVEGSDNGTVSQKGGYQKASQWARELRGAVKKGEVHCEVESMFKWKVEDLKPEKLALVYSFGSYMESTPARLANFAALVRRVETSKQIPAPIEVAKIFGFESVADFEADWKKFILEGNFK